jgi:predicted DCC family thiol-disulfide oxidoreductase YuxK
VLPVELNRASQHRISISMAGLQSIGDRLLVIYDGHCGLCNGWVQWLLHRDRNDRLRFAPFSPPELAPLLAQNPDVLDHSGTPGTILVFRAHIHPDSRPLMRSQAALAVLRELPAPWPAIATLLGWIPLFLRDPIYRFIARWRYRIWGRLANCPIPTPQQRERFL